jgi:DNA-binding NarL/FixJ family response regulator
VEQELRELRVPVLVMHPRGFPSVTEEESMRVAALTPGARFVLIDGDRRNVYGNLHGDPDQGLAAIDAFLNEVHGDASKAGAPDGLSSRECEVLRLLAAGRSNPQIAEALVISSSTVAKHVSSILAKTGTANRTEAAVYARDHGLA